MSRIHFIMKAFQLIVKIPLMMKLRKLVGYQGFADYFPD